MFYLGFERPNPQKISILPSKEKCATVRRIHGRSLFETSSSLTHEQALGLSLRGLIEAECDHVEHPHLDNDISRGKKKIAWKSK